ARQGRVRRLPRRHGRDQVHAGAHARSQRALPQAEENRARRVERRSLSLSRGAHAQSPAGGGLQQGADGGLARGARDVSQEDRRAAVDRTRQGGDRRAQEGAGVLRLGEARAAVPASFYEPLAPDAYRSTAATVGPWDAGLQHGGPPAALL